MDRIVQKLSSPLLRRRSLTDRHRNFGVPIKSLLYKKSFSVPKIVENICQFILNYGLYTEGIFRVNGNTKSILNLKSQFDITSGDDLSGCDCEDIHAICGVLKLFLREIPEGIIPDNATKQTVKIMDQLKDQNPQCLLKLRNIVTNLPEENYNLLRYICHFLKEIAANESSTKMSASNLGIVFGPCFFKCGLGVQGLRQQNLSNLATTYFISHFDTIFAQPSSPAGDRHNQVGLLKSATSLNSLLQRRRRGAPRHSMVAVAFAEDSAVVTAAGPSVFGSRGLRSRPVSPRGDAASPLLTPSVGAEAGGYGSAFATHSISSLSLSPSRNWRSSDAEDVDLGSHGALARELASIMTSISIPLVTKLNQNCCASASSEVVDATPTPTLAPGAPKITAAASSAPATDPMKDAAGDRKPEPPMVVVEDLAKSMPSLVHLRSSRQSRCCADPAASRHHHHHRKQHIHVGGMGRNRRVWGGAGAVDTQTSGGPVILSSDSSSSATSLLEMAAELTPMAPPESTTEAATHTLTLEEESGMFEPCHAHLSSPIFSKSGIEEVEEKQSDQSVVRAGRAGRGEEEDAGEEEEGEEGEKSTTTVSSAHHFPRSKYRHQPLSFSSPNTELRHRMSQQLLHGVLKYIDEAVADEISIHASLDQPLFEFRVPPPSEAKVTMVPTSDECGGGGGTAYHHLVKASSPPRILVANPVASDVTPRPQRILTWPKKRNILSRIHNRRSLDVCIPLGSLQSSREVTAAAAGATLSNLSGAAKVRLVEALGGGGGGGGVGLDLGLNDPMHLETSGFLAVLQAVLESRRNDCHRPEDLEKMSSIELAQEKLDLQKCLLYFEKAKGRPTDSVTKRIMKPLYDRYRCVRRMVRLSSTSAVRLSRGRSSVSAEAVEPPVQASSSLGSALEPSIQVQVDPSPTPEPLALLITSSTNLSQPETEKTTSLMSKTSETAFLNWDLSLLEFAKLAKDLEQKELRRGRAEILSIKHDLQRFLHDYEKSIQEETNHPPSKKDRDRLRGEYNRYRDCKQRLYVIDGFLERPQTSLENLLVDAQSVGRAHKRKKVVDLNANPASGILQQSPGNMPILQPQDSTPCT